MIQAMGWDARVLGLAAGQLLPENDFLVGSDELDAYDLVHVRVPQVQLERVQKLESLGFRYIGLDVELERTQAVKANSPTDAVEWRIQHVQHSDTDFEIQGFIIEDSRFMLDARCKERLVANFWDGVVREHCENFADTVICAIDGHNRLCGLISCIHQPDHIQMFLVAIHPDVQNRGLGGLLVQEAASMADQQQIRLRTNVMASNTLGFNFYLKQNFQVNGAEIIMHRWREEMSHDP